MFCHNCGNQVPDGDKFCRNCGASIIENTNNINTQAYTSYPSEEEELLKAYIGKNYEKFTTRNFNIWPMLFPCIYTLYRKCYLYFFIAILIALVPGLGFLTVIIYAIVLSFCFNGWYLKKAGEDIAIIRHTHPSASLEELKQLAAKSGGTNVLAAALFGGFITLIVVLFGFAIFVVVTGIKDIYNGSFYDEYSEIFENGTVDEDDEYSDGILKGKLKDLYYEVPISYSLEDYKKNKFGKYVYKYDTTSYCRVEIKHEGTALEEYLDTIEIDDSKWIEENIHNNAYKTITLNEVDDNSIPYTNYYYVINKYNETYIFLFTDFNDTKESCPELRQELLEKANYNHTLTPDELDVA